MQTPKIIFRQLKSVASEIYPGLNPRSIACRWGAMVLVLFKIKRIGQWLHRNRNNPILLDELHNSSRVFGAMLRPYVNKNWAVAKRLDALEQHYLALEDKGRLFAFNEKQYLDLVQLGPKYLDLRIVIDKPSWMRSEGEIAVSLFFQTHRIYSVMFLVTGNSGCRRLVVGAIQGCGRPQAKSMYVALTRALHGCRPRDFLINVLKMIATNLGCSEIYGVSDACHRSGHLLSRAAKATVYDDIWQESGGQQNSEGFFVISTELRKREPDEIPARKRAQYRRRYELIHNIQQQINHSFATNERVLMNHLHLEQKAAPTKCDALFQIALVMFYDHLDHLEEVVDLQHLWDVARIC